MDNGQTTKEQIELTETELELVNGGAEAVEQGGKNFATGLSNVGNAFAKGK